MTPTTHRCLALLLAAAPAIAQAQPALHPEPLPAASPATRVELALDLAATGAPALDADAVQAAIAAELGVHVTRGDAFAPALGRLHVLVDAGAVRVSYEPAAGSAIERSVALPDRADERVQVIAFVAANLVRDQAGELLAALAAPPPAPPPAPTPARLDPPPLLVPAATPVLAPVGAPEVELAATIGFIPPLAVDRLAGSRVIVGAGLHALIGATDGARYVSISGLVDTQRVFVAGFQIAGLGAIAGRLDGGVQLGGLGAIARGDADGLQVGGLVAAAGGRMRGIQLGGLAAIAERVDGVQVAGIANVGGDVHGAQIGVVNVARAMHGLQVGVVNVMDDGDDAYPIGLLNFARNGGVAVDAWAESSKLSALALRHGPRHLHNVWSLGWSPDHDHVLAGAGLGTTLRIADRATLDVDALAWWTDVWAGKLSQLDQLRATVAIPLGPVEAIGGVAANVYVGRGMNESADFHPWLARTLTSDTATTHVVSWPTAFVGVRVRAR